MGLERLLAGHLLCDRYRVDGLLGRGGMGAVYRAWDVRLERAVAVKVITTTPAELGARLRLRERFHREARAAAALQHPNVVTVYDYGTDAGLDLDFLVMEVLRGEDLASRLARAGRPELGVALEIVAQAAEGVAAGHRAGLIHRDIKPGNLLVATERAAGFRVCVLDFGIVQLATEDDQATATQLTVAGRVPLSPAYAAPEQLRGESRLTAAVDVWALGATAFHVLTGVRPFGEPDQRRFMQGAAVRAPSARALNEAVPAAVDEVLSIALAQRPADRFRDAGAFAEALASARRGGSSTAAYQPGPAAGRQAVSGTVEHTLLEPAAKAAPRGRRWGSAPRWPTAPPPEDGDGTLLAAPVTAIPAYPPPADLPRSDTPELEGQVALPSQPAASEATRRSWLRRAGRAIWHTTVTIISLAAATLFGIGMFRAFDGNLVEPFYASVVGLTLTIPWAIYRLVGRRGSYVLAMVSCVLVSIAIFRFLAPLTNPVIAVVSLPLAQVVTTVCILRRTGRQAGPASSATSPPP